MNGSSKPSLDRFLNTHLLASCCLVTISPSFVYVAWMLLTVELSTLALRQYFSDSLANS